MLAGAGGLRVLGARCAQRISRGMSTSGVPKLQVLVSNTNDPFFNLATEEYLFRFGDVSVNTLYLWRNEPTIVIGRCQNPWKECNVQAMEDKGVHLARRFSGGGAVYQDLGNTNFTFLSSVDNHDKERNSGIIIRALEKFGLKANASGRNDIEIDGHKISGAAYKIAPPRALHHGTLLINVDMTALGNLLNPNKLKLQSKGVKSVTARVANLQTLNAAISHEALSDAVVDSFCAHYGAPAARTRAARTRPNSRSSQTLQRFMKRSRTRRGASAKPRRYGPSAFYRPPRPMHLLFVRSPASPPQCLPGADHAIPEFLHTLSLHTISRGGSTRLRRGVPSTCTSRAAKASFWTHESFRTRSTRVLSKRSPRRCMT